MRWIQVGIVWAVAMLVQACGGTVYNVDHRFTAEERAQIQAAADAWQGVGGEPLDFIWDQKVASDDNGFVIVRARERELGVSDLFADPDLHGLNMQRTLTYERVIIPIDRLSPGEFQRTITHELGHHYFPGVEGHGGIDAVMYHDPKFDFPTGADHLAMVRRGQP